jgi:hypothetical protein
VTFTVDGVPQAPVSLVNGVASLTLATLPAGSHTIAAGYGGDTTFAGSTASLTETITARQDVTPAVTATAPGLQDVSGLVTVTRVLPRGKHGMKARVNPLQQTLSVTNTSGAPILGPIYLVLDGLTTGVTLTNAAGLSQTHVTPGDPFVLLAMDQLGAGRSLTVNLLFATARKKPQVSFNTFVLAGPGVV